MKRGKLIFLCLILLTSLALPCILFADEETENLISIVIESFDNDTKASDWIVQGSKFATEEYPKIAIAEGWPEALHGANWDEKDYEVLAVSTKYDRTGYNYVELIPVKTADDGSIELNPLSLKGRVKSLDLWVLGTRYDYYIEAHIRDYRGVIHVLNLGNLKYEGWKNLKANIPSYIPQSSNYAPYFKGLELVKLMVWTTPQEKVDDYIMFIDQIKILTDDFITRFDGDDLLQPDKLNSINWSDQTGE